MNSKLKIKNLHPELWASIARITACGMIFLFHYAGLYNYYLKPLDIYAIVIFMLLSGYFSVIKKIDRHTISYGWLLRRVKSIMIPYWSVILLVIVINEFYHYKEMTLSKKLIIVAGGSMFLDNPLYTISWFITLILLLYGFVFVFQVMPGKIYKSFVFLSGLVLFFFLSKSIYYLAFLSGFGFRLFKEYYFSSVPLKRVSQLNQRLYHIQNYCYSFFLLHGGVLLFCVEVIEFQAFYTFVVSLILTIIATYIHYHFSDMLQKKIIFPFE